jgi:hypothetical protein
MPGRALAAKWIVPVVLAVGTWAGAQWAAAGEDPRTAERFLNDLRDRGLHDLALDFIHLLRNDSQLPANVKAAR